MTVSACLSKAGIKFSVTSLSKIMARCVENFPSSDSPFFKRVHVMWSPPGADLEDELQMISHTSLELIVTQFLIGLAGQRSARTSALVLSETELKCACNLSNLSSTSATDPSSFVIGDILLSCCRALIHLSASQGRLVSPIFVRIPLKYFRLACHMVLFRYHLVSSERSCSLSSLALWHS